MRGRSDTWPIGYVAVGPSCKNGHGTSVCCRAPSDWSCSSCWHARAMMSASPTAFSASRLVPQFVISKPKTAGFRMGLHPRASSINCGRVNDGICATFELTFFGGLLVHGDGRREQAFRHSEYIRHGSIRMTGKYRLSRWFVAVALLATVDCAGVIAVDVALMSPAQAQFRDNGFFGFPFFSRQRP